MRLRKPPRDAPDWELETNAKKTYKVELITPMYGGGVKAGEPDIEMPVRVAAIRGHN